MSEVSQTCKKCTRAIIEGHAYELGDDRWHIDCFKCFKCDTSLGCNSNFLVLGNGSLVCSNCSYSCKQCGKKIDDLAILTGDQAYCSGCFKCRVCKSKIEDLRYARTSKGLFCMACHEELIAKKKKHDMKRKQLASLSAQARPASNGESDGSNSANIANSGNLRSLGPASTSSIYSQRNPSSTSLVNKQLPPPPTAADSRESAESLPSGAAPVRPPHVQATPSYTSTTSVSTQRSAASSTEPRLMGSAIPRSPHRPGGSDRSDVTDANASYDIEEVNDSDDELNIRQAREQLERRLMGQADESDGAILDVINAFSAPNTPSTIYNHAESAGASSSHAENGQSYSENGHGYSDAHERNKDSRESKESRDSRETKESHETPVLRQERAWTGDPASPHKNILLLSPGQYQDDFRRSRSAVSSPMARANRQARVLETTDGNSTSELSTEPQSPAQSTGYRYAGSSVTTPKRGGTLRSSPPLSSPPPRLALPEVPSTPQAPERASERGSERLSERAKERPIERFNERSTERFSERLVEKHLERPESSEPRGLGLDNIDLNKARTIKSPTPAVTNLEEPDDGDADADYHKSPPSRLPSMRRKISVKHKRSISNGSGGISSKLGFFKPKEEGSASKGHGRHMSDGSVHGQAFTTPPLPFSSSSGTLPYRDTHARSSSDTNFITSMENDASKREFEMRSIKFEIYQLDTRRQALLADNMKLNSDKSKLSESLGSLLKQIELETQKKESLVQEVSDLVVQKQKLTEENRKLTEENASLHSTVSQNRELQRESTDRHGSNVFEHNETFESNFTTESLHDEGAETQKATRLKFWRRPKVTIANAQGMSTQNNSTHSHHSNGGVPQSVSSYKLNQTFPTNMIQNPSQSSFNDENGGRKPLNGFVSKSRSTTILDSFLNGSNGSDVPLLTSTLQRRAVFENEKVPLIITKCIEEVESRGLDVEGIYRLSGGNSAISAIESAFASIPSNGANDKRQLAKLNEVLGGDINAVTSALKRYLRKLPDPLVPFGLYENFIRIGQRVSEGSNLCDDFRARVINRLPPANKHAMYLIGKHLLRVNEYNNVNRMNFKNLSVVFAPTIARDATGEREMVDMGYRNDATEFLFTNFNNLFEGYTDTK